MSKMVIIDPGHGGVYQGVYQTPGKRSPKWEDLPQLFEGVQNRQIATLLKGHLTLAGIPFIDVAPDYRDVPLTDRVYQANRIHWSYPRAIYVSIHADAAGDGTQHHPASGVSVYTSPGQTKSDKLASHVLDALKVNLDQDIKWRYDYSDGDADKEENFYVLTKTKSPAILCELGFFTNREQCEKMHTEDWKARCALSIFEGIKKYYQL